MKQKASSIMHAEYRDQVLAQAKAGRVDADKLPAAIRPYVRVLMDGCDLRRVVWADEPNGQAGVIAMDSAGGIVRDAEGDPVVVVVWGKVEVAVDGEQR